MTRPTTPVAIEHVLRTLAAIADDKGRHSREGCRNIAKQALAAYAARLPLADDDGLLREMREAAFANPEHAGPRAVLALIDKKLTP